MKLYFSKSACSLAVRIVINELGLPSQFESVDLKTKKTQSGEDFLKINPKGAVPVLETDHGEILTENSVIQQYLADVTHATVLLPAIGDFNRYRVLEWLNYVSSELHKTVGLTFNPFVTQDMKESMVIPLTKKKLAYLNEHFEKHTYLAGDSFTLPDAYCFVILTWLPVLPLNLDEWPHVKRYFEALKGRNSIQQSLHEEGLA